MHADYPNAYIDDVHVLSGEPGRDRRSPVSGIVGMRLPLDLGGVKESPEFRKELGIRLCDQRRILSRPFHSRGAR